MGLDMYLYKKTYIQNWDHMRPEERHTVTVTKGGKPVPYIKPSRIAYITEAVAYWRKANQIHNWFVENVQKGVDDCGDYYVPTEKLQELVDTCKKLLITRDNPHKELPTQGGFFFGSTNYDEWYWRDLESTVAQLEPLLKEDGFGDFYYHSSW